MALTLTSSVRAGITWSYTSTNDVGDTQNASGFSFSDSLSTGTAVDQADRLYVVNTSIAASGNLQLDLAGSLTDVFGNVLTFARVKAVLITFDSDNTASGIRVGGGTDGLGGSAFVGWFNDATDMENVDKTGVFFKFRADATAWPVTAGTADILRILNLDGANAALLNIAIVGASA